jgi:hypothetical protein
MILADRTTRLRRELVVDARLRVMADRQAHSYPGAYSLAMPPYAQARSAL